MQPIIFMMQKSYVDTYAYKRKLGYQLKLGQSTVKLFRWFPSSSYCLYTQVPAGYRHSGRDAGIQSHGCESSKTPRASTSYGLQKLPSMALDTGIHAGMTTPGHTCI